jgi:hypothetical protein
VPDQEGDLAQQSVKVILAKDCRKPFSEDAARAMISVIISIVPAQMVRIFLDRSILGGDSITVV